MVDRTGAATFLKGRADQPPNRDISRSNERRRELLLLLPASTLTVMAGTVLAPVLEPLQDSLGLSTSVTGLVLTAHSVGLVVASPFVGWLSTRLGLRLLLGGGMAIYALAGAAGALAGSPGYLLMSRVVVGVGVAAIFTGTTVALLNHQDGTQASRVMGWRSIALSVGGVSWPLMSGFLGSVEWRLAFTAHLVALPLAVIAFLWLPTNRPLAETQSGGAVGGSVGFRPEAPLMGAFGLQLLASILLYAVIVFTPLRLGELDVRDPRVVALSPVAVSASMSLSGALYHRLRAALGDLRLLAAAFFLWSMALLTVGTSQQPTLLFVACGAFGFGMGVAVPSLTLLVSNLAPERSQETAVSVLGSVTFGGQLLSPLLLGPFADRVSINGALGLAAAIAVLTAISLLNHVYDWRRQ